MAKERELKEAVREGRDRVSQEVFLRVIFLFWFLSFSLISHELKHVTISRDGRNSITLAKIGWPLATYFCFGRLRNHFSLNLNTNSPNFYRFRVTSIFVEHSSLRIQRKVAEYLETDS